MKKTAFAIFPILILLLGGCHIRGGEPSQSELFSALADQFEHANDRGGIKINMGNAGAFQNIQFKFKLHHLEKHSCTGANNVYTCKITISVSYPPVKDELEVIESSMVVFDGPGGWRVIE
ncbi:MAG: hypothetical protein ACREO1_00230 [Arenimonas sp.]